MVFYILLVSVIFSLILVAYVYPKTEKGISLLLLGIMILLGGFRDRIGSDYDSYISWYLKGTRDEDFEFGFVAIMNLFRALHLSSHFLFFFFSFFTCLFVYLGIKNYTKNINLALLCYILIPSLYITSFTLVRQSFSVAISFYAFYYLINKKYFTFFLLMLIGVSIHRTCLIAFLVFLFTYRFADKIKIVHLVFALMTSLILSKLNFHYLFSGFFKDLRYSYYFSNQQISVNFIKIIILNGVGLFILFYFDKLKKAYPYQKYLFVLYFFSLVSVNLFSTLNDLSRIYTYFRIFEIIVVVDLIFLENNRKRVFLFSFFFMMYFGTFLNGLKTDFEIQNTNMPKYIPYKNLLW